MKRRKHITKIYTAIMCAITTVAILPICAWSNIQTQAAIDRKYELINQGYDGAVIFDQLLEEFDQVDGPYGTGGIDGLKLDGTPAGGNSSVPSTTTPSQPSTPAHTHSWTAEVIKDATCQEKGEIQYTCVGCSESYTEGSPVVDHNYEATGETPATCISYSTITFTCTVCGNTSVEEKGELAEHIYIATNDSYEATCEEAGHMKYVCSVCGDSYEETPEALGHEWPDEYTVDTKAGCTTEGMKSIHCERCDIVKEGSEIVIEPMGHTEKETHQIVEPTFWEDGSETITCQKCNEVIEIMVLPATGGAARILIPVVGVLGIVGVIIAAVLARKKR